MNDFEIVFYRRASGECPVCDFLDSLNKEGIFELRAQTRTDITRIMFFFDENRKIVLTNGFIKKTQKMPLSEFELAKKYRSDYLSRKKELESSQKSSRPTSGPQWRPKLDDIMSSAESRRSPSISRDSLSREKDR